MWLLASVLVLGLGPLLFWMAGSRRRLLSALDGFLLVAIGGLVLLDVLPEAVEHSGWLALLMAAIGFLGPTVVEHTFQPRASQAHRIATVLGLCSLGLHALADGAALVGARIADSDHALPLAVVLHRIPVGLTVWWLVRAAFGRRAAVAVLGLVGLATLAGFAFGDWLLSGWSQAVGHVQALVAGSLLHVVVHRTEFSPVSGTPELQRQRNRLAALGALAGVILLYNVMSTAFPGGDAGPSFTAAFLTLTMESAAPLLLAYLAAGLISGFLPRASVAWMNRGAALAQSLRGMAIGLPLPVCSCGVVPLFRTLSRQGAPAAGAVAFLIATPELSLDALILSIPLLGIEMTLIRLVGAALVALLVGLAVGIYSRRPGNGVQPPPETVSEVVLPPLGVRFRESLKLGFGEVVDHTAPWILLGLGMAALLAPYLDPLWLRQLPSALEVPLFALLGIPMYVCASGATPLVAVLLFKGVSPGAALAFLLTGPATNLTTFGVVADVLGRKTALFFGLTTALLSMVLGYLVNFAAFEVSPLPLDQAAEEGFSWFHQIAAALLTLLFLASFLRQGPRNFLAQIALLKLGSHDHSHPHDAESGCCETIEPDDGTVSDSIRADR